MYTTLTKVLFLVTAVAVAAAPATTACNEDNCLRAVQASAFPTRHGAADCSSYFLTTVTPATTTYTVTMTSSPTTTVEATITNTATVTDTLTTVETIPLTTTTTVGLPTIAPRIVERDNADLRGSKVTIAPRQVTVVPSSIPSYASPCSGSVRYSSACSCIGVTQSTITAVTPSTTVTVTATVSQTVLATMTSSATQTVDVTTTVLDSVVVATQTIVNCGPLPTFILQAVGGGSDNGMYAQLVSANDGLNDDVLVFVSSASAATHFNIDAAGHINANGFYGNIEAGVQHFLFYFNTPADISSFGYVYATCSIDTTGTLQCVDQTSTLFQISPSVVSSGTGGAGVVIGAYIEQGNILVSFTATCV